MKSKRWLCIILSIVMILGPAGHLPAVSAAEQTAAALPAAVEQADETDIFSRVWEQMTDEILTVYEAYRTAPSTLQSAAIRLKLEPDTLNLLNLLSNTLANLEIGWVDEIGVDILPDIPEVPQTVSPYQNYGIIPQDPAAWERPVKDVPVPALTALLHVNGREIAAADAWVDPGRRIACVALPGLVSGQLATSLGSTLDRDTLNGFFTSYALSMYKEDLLPPEGLLQKILEIPGTTPGVFELTGQENGRLAAGSVTQDCTIYTGQISLRNAAGLLQVLLEKASSDQEFRDMIRAYLDSSLWKTYQEKLAIQAMLDQLARELFYTYSMEQVLDEYYIRMAVQSGEWEYLKNREELLEEERLKLEQEAKEAAETAETAGEIPDETEPAFGYRNLDVEPGRPLTIEEAENLSTETIRFLQRALWNREIGLTREYRPSDILFFLLEQYQDVLRASIQEMIASVPEGVVLEPAFRLNQDGQLIGLSLSMADPYGDQFPLLDAGAASDRDNRALTLQIGGEYGPEVLLENLAVQGSGGRELHFNLVGKDTLPVAGEGRLTIRPDSLQVDLHLNQDYELLLSAKGTYLTEDGSADFEIRLPSGGGTENSLRLTGSLDPVTGNGHYVLRLNGILGVNSSTAYRMPAPEIRIDTEQIGPDEGGVLQGKAAFSLGNWPGNVIPEGMKLVLDLGGARLQLADSSAVYASLEIVEPAWEAMTDAAARIQERNDPAYYAAAAGRSSFGYNWNVPLVLNRLMQAGMPADLLGDTSLAQLQQDLNALPDLLDELGLSF